jgi:CHAP domain.
LFNLCFAAYELGVGGFEGERDMRLSGKKTKITVQILGCLTAVLGFSQISHASTQHRKLHPTLRHAAPAHKVVYHDRALTAHRIIHRAPIVHRAVRHVAVRHEIFHRPVETHAVYRRIAVRRPDYRHGYIEHHYVPHRFIRRADYLWCVPYARDVSHIDLTGDAFLWWAEAAGRYQRGERPEPGAVLNFRSSSRIPLGHVAVVSRVINSREILVDQANWVPDSVTRNVPVIDVSPNNNWSEVQVSIGGGQFGATYPTYGFIYDQHPGAGMIYAHNAGSTEVAAAPPVTKIRLIAPDRTLR